jgi:hypothetical protein
VKPLWQLAPSADSPRLTHGYMFTLLVAFVPVLWFRYMAKPLAEWDETMASPLERRVLAGAGWRERAA